MKGKAGSTFKAKCFCAQAAAFHLRGELGKVRPTTACGASFLWRQYLKGTIPLFAVWSINANATREEGSESKSGGQIDEGEGGEGGSM